MTAKRFTTDNGSNEDVCLVDNITGNEYESNFKDIVELLNELHEEKEMWKRECKRLKGLYYLENENVELEDIIGLVKTDEPTNSVELKKELYK